MLKIVTLDHKHLANLYQDPGLPPRLEIIEEKLHAELEAFFQRIQADKIYLVGGRTISHGDQVVRQTHRKQVMPGDPDFLSGVQDMLTRQKVTLGGVRVRGLLIGTQEGGHV